MLEAVGLVLTMLGVSAVVTGVWLYLGIPAALLAAGVALIVAGVLCVATAARRVAT